MNQPSGNYTNNAWYGKNKELGIATWIENGDFESFKSELKNYLNVESPRKLNVEKLRENITNEDDDVAPSIGFGTTTSSENETDITFTSANIPITVANYSGTQIDINVSVTGGSAEVGDYTFTSPTALSFTACSNTFEYMSTPSKNKQRVVIIGGGFGGCTVFIQV